MCDNKHTSCCKFESDQKFSFAQMQKELYKVFEEDRIDVEDVKEILKRYKSNEADWGKFALDDPHKYTRNLVDSGNGKFNLLILVWGPGQESSIHDHTKSHCFMKNLQGTVRETRYEWPKGNERCEMKQKGDATNFSQDEVFYISDEHGLHRVGNPSHTDRTVTLHLYSPPFDHCQTFDDRTSEKKTVPMTFYSRNGKKE